eukprot:gene5143-10281_t
MFDLSSFEIPNDGWAVFVMIFMAEFGDRTFFVAMMLATKFNAMAVYTGSMLGLLVCTGLSVFVGYASTQVLSPRILDSISAAIFLGYAAVTFWELKDADSSAEGLLEEANKDVIQMMHSHSLSKIGSAEGGYGSVNAEPVIGDEETATSAPKVVAEISATFKLMAIIWTVALSEFVGEIGDRTSIAVILLTTKYSWFEVYFFAMVAFALVTAIAIGAGKICSKFLSERSVGITSGTAFLIFGLLALAEAILNKEVY